MKTNKYILPFFLMLSFTFNVSCEDTEDTFETYEGETLVSFAVSTQTVGFCDPVSIVTVQSSSLSNSDRTYNLVVNEEMTTANMSEFSGTLSITIPSGEYSGATNLAIDFSAIPDNTQRTLVLDIVGDENTTVYGGSMTINYESVCTLNEVSVNLIFDIYPEEAAYIISNALGTIVDASYDNSGSIAFGTFAGLGSFNKTICIPDGTYTVTFFDSYGDGNTEGTGSYGLSLQSCDGSSELIDALSSSSFGAPGSTLGTSPVSINFTVGG